MDNVKCVISNKSFFIPISLLKEDILKKIKKDLILEPLSSFELAITKNFKIYKLVSDANKKLIGVLIPINYAINEIQKGEFPFEYTTNFPEIKSIGDYTCNIVLRKGAQEEAFEKIKMEYSKPFGGGILNLTTSTGKTPLALYSIAFLKKCSLIIVNKIELLNQWSQEITKFLPNARIGIIQGKTFDVIDKDIVIGMIHTITIKKELTSLDFSFCEACFIDEVHNISTDVFSNVIYKVRPKYLFGLTATLERKDGLHTMINMYLGDILYSNVSTAKKQKTQIHVYKYKGSSSKVALLRDHKTLAVSTMLSNIATDTTRNNLIIKILKDISLDPNRFILVLSDRIAQLKFLNETLPNSSLYIGSMKTHELKQAKESQILLATYKLACEGFNHEKLNCMLFATSRTNINQSIGRIYRKHHTLEPIIVDVVDDFSFFKTQYYKRRKVYLELISKCVFFNEKQDIDAKPSAVLDFLSDSD